MTSHNASYRCARCEFELWHPLWEFDASVLGLAEDARFPGRCILVLRDHYEHLEEVPASLLSSFMAEVRTAGRAIRAALHVDRMNYAALGNTDPHVHLHLIPRRADGDPIPTKAPWDHPEPRTALSEDERTRVMQSIVAELERESRS